MKTWLIKRSLLPGSQLCTCKVFLILRYSLQLCVQPNRFVWFTSSHVSRVLCSLRTCSFYIVSIFQNAVEIVRSAFFFPSYLCTTDCLFPSIHRFIETDRPAFLMLATKSQFRALTVNQFKYLNCIANIQIYLYLIDVKKWLRRIGLPPLWAANNETTEVSS